MHSITISRTVKKASELIIVWPIMSEVYIIGFQDEGKDSIYE